MREILHILKKDVKRHWPEILFSLALLGTYSWREIHPPSKVSVAPVFLSFLMHGAYIAPALVILWAILIVRLVQGETLVGDRQWWVTKPYEWWKLLNAKVLFVVVFVGVPLFVAQAILLHEKSFPVLRNLGKILGMDFALASVLILPSIAIGTLTKGLGQAVIGAISLLLALGGVFGLIALVPSGQMSSAASAAESTQAFLLIGSLLFAAIWQYVRRKTWIARTVVLASFLAIALIGVLMPYEKFVEEKYHLIEDKDLPVKLTVLPAHAQKGKRRIHPSSQSEIYLHFPIMYSGVTVGSVVMIDGLKATLETTTGAKWNAGWKQEWIEMWNGVWNRDVWYPLKRKDYEKFKTATLRLQLDVALTEYQEQDERELVLNEGNFSDTALGNCHIDPENPSQLNCSRPFHQPGLMATFDPAEAKCVAEERDDSMPENGISHAWLASSGEDSFDPGINPVTEYSIYFTPRLSSLFDVGPNRKMYAVRLCPGAKVKLARPKEKRSLRVKLEMNRVRLQDLTVADFASE